MPRYFFHVRDGHAQPDAEGLDLPDVAEAWRQACRLTGKLLNDRPFDFLAGEAWSMEVRDDTGMTLFILHFFATRSPAMSGSVRPA